MQGHQNYNHRVQYFGQRVLDYSNQVIEKINFSLIDVSIGVCDDDTAWCVCKGWRPRRSLKANGLMHKVHGTKIC